MNDVDKVVDIQLSTSGDNSLETGAVPIIFVPGIMGSRLHFMATGQYWDPDHPARMLHWASLSPEQMHKELYFWKKAAIVTHPEEDLSWDQISRGWGTVAWNFYGDLLEVLENQPFGVFRTPVYALGYDWRQSNCASGKYLAQQVEEILQRERTDRFVLISHSMGGLVTRSMLQQHCSLSDKLVGIIHIAQPVLGAAVMYRRLFTGCTIALDGFKMRLLLGNTGQKVQTISSAIPSAIQLLPTHHFDTNRESPWLDWFGEFEKDRRYLQGRQLWRTYRLKHSPPGIVGSFENPHALQAKHTFEMSKRLAQAEKFHFRLDRYRHARTWSIYGINESTDVSIKFSCKSGPFICKTANIAVEKAKVGDGTVPATSAAGLFSSDETLSWADALSKDLTSLAMTHTHKRQFEIDGGAHDEICLNNNCKDVLNGILQLILEHTHEL